MLLNSADIDPENFAELNSEKSYLSLFYGKRDGSDQRDIGLDLAITVDPVSIGLSLGGINAAINDANKSVLPEGFEESNYKSILDPDGVISLNATVQLDLELFGTEDLPDGELPVGDILSNFIANLALSTGVVIDDDIAVGIAIDLGANIYLADAEKTEVSLVIRDSNNTAGDGSDIILAAYLRGDKLYVDMGMLSEDNFYVAGTGVVQFLLGKVNELLAGDGESGVGSSEAVTATNGKSTEEEELEALNIILEATQGHLALSVTEAVLLGIVNAVAGGQEVDINEIFEALGLDANVSVDISFEDPVGLTVAADTKYAALSLAVIKPYISNEPNEKVTEAINKAADAGYNQYVAGVSSFARFGITLSVEYGADATYEEVTDPEELATYDESERYELLPDGTFVQDAEGTYIRNPLTLSDVVGALLSMDAITNALDEMGKNPDQADIAALLNVLLASLGVELYLDDPIGDNLDIRITGLLDLEALGLTNILSTLTMPKLDTQAILNALQVGLELIFNPEDGVDSASVSVYLINGDLYVDLSGLGGPRISVKLFEILDKMGVFNTGGGSEAVTAAGEQCENGHIDEVDAAGNQKPDCVCDVCHEPYHVDVTGGEKDENGNDTPNGKCDKCGMPYASDTVNAVLNALVRAVVFRTNLGGVIGGNVFESGLGLDVMLPSNMLGELVALITGAEEGYVFEDFVLNENESKISLNIGGGNGIELVVSARSNAGFNVSVAAKAGLEIEVATSDSTLLTVGEKRTFIDMTSLMATVIDMINNDKPGYTPVGDGELAFGSQQITLSVSGKAEFESLGDGSYDVGTLLAQWLQDVALNIETDSAFTDGIGFRLTVNADLSKLGFEALFDDSLADADAKAEAFFEKTDLNSIEAALELLDIDAAGNIVDNVLAGIYLSGGTLYLDGTGIFDVVENYSYVANFLTFVIGAIELGGNNGGNNGGNENDPTGGEEGQGPATQALAAAAAVSAAEGDETVVRDALLQLVYSDTAMQIVITKSIISSLLAALVPDLGSIADIFDSFEVSLGADIGRYDYVDISEENEVVFAATESADGEYVAVEGAENVGIIGFTPANGSDAQRYDLVHATNASEGQLYYKAKDGNFYIADGMRYRWVEEEQFVPAGDLSGAYVKVLVDGSAEYLYRYDYVFYTKAANGGYDVVTDLEKVAAGTTVYVRVAGSYIEVSSDENGVVLTYDREYGYVRDAEGDLLRVYHPYTDLDEFYLSLGAEVGSMRVGLSLGGIGLEFGRTKSIVPAYITAGKTKTPTEFDSSKKNYTYDEATGTYTFVPEADGGEAIYYQDFPLMPFYDSVVTVGASVELELAITEGNIDIGQIFSSILGDLEGLVIQIPSTNKGYSSAHLRLDLTLVLDAFDLPSSEIMIELYNLSSESGAEVRWLAANYFNEMLYIDLSFFGLPKLAVPMTEIADMLRDLIGDLLDSSIYQDVEVGGASAEAITADDSASTENDMISTEDKVAALLISKRKLAISVGNAMMRYLLTLLTIGDDPLNMLIYEQLKGGLDVTIDLNKGFDVGIGAELMLEGDRYEFVQNNFYTEEERFFVFESTDPQTAAPEGLFLYDSATNSYREASRSEINAVKDGTSTDTLYVRYEAEKVDGNNWVYYTYTHTGTDTDKWFFDEAADSYVEEEDATGTTPAVTAPEGAKMYTRSEAIEATDKVVYRFKAGAGANPNDYDTVLTLDVNVGDIDMYFTEEREFTLSKEELEDFYEFNGLDTVSLSETISLGLLFADKEEIDLSAVLEYFFPDSDFTAIIGVESGYEEINNILRDIDITVSLEFKLGAFVNYLRSLAARYDLSYDEDGTRVALESLTGDIDLITFINVIRSLIGAKKVPNAEGSIYYTDPNVDDLFGLDDILNFVNASVEIATVSTNDGVPAHTMLGVYYSLGDNEGIAYEDYEGSVTPARYSHYFASEDGIYGYVGVDADKVDGDGYLLISEFAANGIMYDEEVHRRYSRDDSFLYPDANGDRVREYAGLYVDLSYFGQPGVYINIAEMLALVGGLMGGELSLSLSEAVTAADETTEGSEGTESSFSLPYDLGTLFGGDVNLSDSLPLLSEEIASYITAFVYGARITSTYIRILVESDFLTQILTLLTGGPIFNEDLAFEQSYVGINVDFNNYLYAYLNNATTEQIEFSDTRFAIERDDKNGMYWIYTDPLTKEQTLQLRSDMTAAEIADYEASMEEEDSFGYYNITPIETYLHVGDDYVLSSEASNTDWVRADRDLPACGR